MPVRDYVTSVESIACAIQQQRMREILFPLRQAITLEPSSSVPFPKEILASSRLLRLEERRKGRIHRIQSDIRNLNRLEITRGSNRQCVLDAAACQSRRGREGHRLRVGRKRECSGHHHVAGRYGKCERTCIE